MIRHSKLYAALIILVMISAVAISSSRRVEAEDDCAAQTKIVARLPAIGLICFGEPL